jgi:hypothetical protein
MEQSSFREWATSMQVLATLKKTLFNASPNACNLAVAILPIALISCKVSAVPRTPDWWHNATDHQIEEITYRSYCTPDLSTCLPKSAYKIRVTRDMKGAKEAKASFLIVRFERLKDGKMTSISCWTPKTGLALSCVGSGRFNGIRPGIRTPLDYPILWED